MKVSRLLAATAAAFAPIALSTPVSTSISVLKRVEDDTPAANQMWCVATDGGLAGVKYTVDIGVPINNQMGCNDVFHALQNSLGAVGSWLSGWRCRDDGSGNTMLHFWSKYDRQDAINSALQSMYPMVSGGFDCPNKKVKRDGTTDPDTMWCSTTDDGKSGVEYDVHVGEPINNQLGCNDVYYALHDSLSAAGCWISAWRCEDDGEGNMLLHFWTKYNCQDAINAALESVYPMVDGGFNCPNKKVKRDDPNVAKDEQSCHAKDIYIASSGQPACRYHILIGEPYDYHGCFSVYDTLAPMIQGFNSYNCFDDGYGNTQLWFRANYYKADEVNAALHIAYPMVNGLNCPNWKKRDVAPAPSNQICTVKPMISGHVAYDVQIDYHLNQELCRQVQEALQSAVSPIDRVEKFQCNENHFNFETIDGRSEAINNALESVLVEAGTFNCDNLESHIELRAATPTIESTLVKRYGPAPLNQQACHCKQHWPGGHGTWKVYVGEPFDNGSGCNNINQALSDAVGQKYAPQTFKCEDDGTGNHFTYLQFFAQNWQGQKINDALQAMYPMVNKFNCPDF